MRKGPHVPLSGKLDGNIIRGEFSEHSLKLLRSLDVLDEVDSTSLAIQRLPKASQHAHAIIADRQTAGRGRRGRAWHSPSGCNVYLSLGWRFDSPAGLTQLPLAMAVAAARAVHRAGVRGCRIKWPNDLFVAGKKLAGILVELQRGEDQEVIAVIGIGINVGMPVNAVSQSGITQAWTEMTAHMVEPVTPNLRSRVCGTLLDELVVAVSRYSQSGFRSFFVEWSELDLLRGREVRLETGKEVFEGIAVGISERGGLLVASTTPAGSGHVKEFVAGEVSVRLAET